MKGAAPYDVVSILLGADESESRAKFAVSSSNCTPHIHEFFESLADLRKSHQMRNNVQLMNACKDMEGTFSDLLTTVTGRLESFDRHTRDMWDNLSAERFRKIESVIKTFHTMMGGILCALTVKMDAWISLFPDRRAGAPGRRADFILNDMRHGMQRIREIEAHNAPIKV